MFFTVYKITNIVNGKYYIGMHKTKDLDDGYMGSGTYIRRSIRKYGKENFIKEILFVFDNEQDMRNKEKELVVIAENTYNLNDGGAGGWAYANRTGLRTKGHTPEMYQRISDKLKGRVFPHMAITMKKNHERGLVPYDNFRGKTHTEETKQKIGKANSKLTGDKNSQYGTMWITNGFENKKIKALDMIPEGWYKGRNYTTIA
jgi:hypothetical protein